MRRLLAVVSAVAVATAGGVVGLVVTADAADVEPFQDKNFAVTGDCVYDEGTDTTTCTFTVSGDEAASHLLVIPCVPDAEVLDGPPIEFDGSTDHNGSKIENGTLGEHSITYAGFVGFIDVVVKNGPGHKHFHVGAESCTPEPDPDPDPENGENGGENGDVTDNGDTAEAAGDSGDDVTTTTVTAAAPDGDEPDAGVAGAVAEREEPVPAPAEPAEPQPAEPRFAG